MSDNKSEFSKKRDARNESMGRNGEPVELNDRLAFSATMFTCKIISHHYGTILIDRIEAELLADKLEEWLRVK